MNMILALLSILFLSMVLTSSLSTQSSSASLSTYTTSLPSHNLKW